MNPELEPVGRRTRLQKSIKTEKWRKMKKQARITARKRFQEVKAKQSELNPDFTDDVSDSNSREEAVAVDESEFLKRIQSLGIGNRICYNNDPLKPNNFDENENSANHIDGFPEKGKGLMIDYRKDYDSDDSVQIIAEKWNPIGVYDADSSDYDNGGGGEDDNGGCSAVEPKGNGLPSSDVEVSSEEDDNVIDHDFDVKNPEDFSSSEVSSSTSYDSSSTEDEVCGEGLDNHGDGSGGMLAIKDKQERKKKKKLAKFEFRRRVDEGLDNHGDGSGPTSHEKNLMRKTSKGKRKKSDEKADFPRKKSKEGKFVIPGTDENLPVHERVRVFEDGRKRERVRPSKKDKLVFDSNLEEKEEHIRVIDSILEKRDLITNEVLELIPLKKKRGRKLKAKEVEDVLLNKILENGSEPVVEDILSPEEVQEQEQDQDQGSSEVNQDQDDLPRKFRFEDEKDPVPEKTESELEIDELFKELDFMLGVCDIGAQTSCLYENEVEDAVLCDSAISQEKLCRQGKHYLIHDDEIGIKCKFCSIVVLEIRDVTPDFDENPFGKSRNSGRLSEQDNTSDDFELTDSINDSEAAHGGETLETVWDLIPGIKGTMFEHQQKGFEFIWKNVAGGIQINELGKPSESSLGGCIICHAPGTGKSRLAIVFLQSYMKQYPMSKPVIIAPSSMLLTWEDQFAQWQVDIPFVNLNSPELSSKETGMLKYVNKLKHSKAVRKAKLCIWAMGKGILGISYRMFEKLAGERKNLDEVIKKALLEQSGILVLDEGHTPRNDESNIWKVFSEVKTKKRIILSGTPFQNNFTELNNTLSIIREEFGDPLLRGNHFQSGRKNKANKRVYGDTNSRGTDEERRIEELRNRLKPYVHVHKGEILRKTLRGLFHSVILLKPSNLQKSYIRKMEFLKNGLLLDYLVSIASVHPSLLYMCEQVPEFVDKKMLTFYQADLDVGVKIKFLFELIKLSKGEKVLVFSQYLIPLTFIGDLLKLHFNWTEGNEYLLMVGKLRPKQRQSLIGLFNDPGSAAKVLLASTKACCEGIHLVGASRVVLLDVVWNPSVERQAISRAYRLGQKKDVFVYHLLTSGTLEREKYERQLAKERVSEQVFISTEAEGVQNPTTLSMIAEDRILEEMIQHENLKCLFEKITYQHKADNLIESFGPLNL